MTTITTISIPTTTITPNNPNNRHNNPNREYLDLEFRDNALAFGYSLERTIDDFVVLCFLVGNDFMPHLPSLDIGEGGLDTLFQIYRERRPGMGGYIVENGEINSCRLEQIFMALGQLEEQVTHA